MKKISYKNYNIRQHKKIYGSTVDFIKFIEKHVDLNKKNIIDLACGGGANTIFLAKKYPRSTFLGIDYDKQQITTADKFIKKLKNISFKNDLWQNINLHKNFIKKNKGGLISFQSLSFIDMPISNLLKKLNKRSFPFLAFSSLFYEGKCNYKIYVNDFSKSEFTQGYYNIHSAHTLKKILKENGYKKFKFEKFNIKYNLVMPKHGGMQSYTRKLKSNKKIIFSGGLYLPYGFFLAY